MAVGDDNSPYGEVDQGSKHSDPRSGSTALVPVPVPVHRMHDGRVVSHAGRMVAGSLVPVPPIKGNHHGAKATHWRVTLSVALAALIFSGGSAILLSGVLHKSRTQKVMMMQTNTAAGETRQGQNAPVQSLAITEARTPPPRRDVADNQLNIKGQQNASAGPRNASNLAVTNINGAAGQALPIKISVQRGQAEDYSFVMFRGVPNAITISSGFRVKDSWAVSLHDLDRLSLEAADDFSGTFNLEVVLIKGRDTPVEKRMMSVNIQKGKGSAAVVASNAGGEPQMMTASIPANEKPAPAVQRPRSQAPAPASLPPAQENAILEKAAKLINENDVLGARLLFEYLANRGSGKAALALGQTFDPAFFQTVQTVGMQPDPKLAKNWYKKAADLGNQEAVSRLAALQTP